MSYSDIAWLGELNRLGPNHQGKEKPNGMHLKVTNHHLLCLIFNMISYRHHFPYRM